MAKFTQDKNSNVLVVDSMNLAFRWKHQGKKDFVQDFIRTIESLAVSYDCYNIIIAADQGNSAYRKEICPEYKANRKEKYENQTEAEKKEMEEFFNEYEATLQALSEKYLVLRRSYVEADDIAAFIVLRREEFEIDNIWLISSDRDWDLLVNEYVSKFSTVTRKETTLYNWSEFHDFPIEEYISFKVLTGDKGDNIEGIPGIGPKRASDLIKQYGNAFDIYDAIPIEGKYKYIENLNKNSETLLVNYKLMDLISHCEDAIGFPGHDLLEIKDEIRNYLNDN